MDQYYKERLAAERLKKCYDIAPLRVQQYLEAEIQHVLTHISPTDLVIELGCGYGRVLQRIGENAAHIIGIDTARESMEYARQTKMIDDCTSLIQMDAGNLGFRNAKFDVVVCIQNGLSAFKVDSQQLVKECVRITKPGGVCLFSSYCEEFWEPRLEWFQLQSEEGLLGEIDWDATRDGEIVCHDGFRATTVSVSDFEYFVHGVEAKSRILKVDNSSLFLELVP
jgi:2-polyprenyl-6-hydroxyphenyl methylase/3-demethylubiquinone-9 3-methyltransferase